MLAAIEIFAPSALRLANAIHESGQFYAERDSYLAILVSQWRKEKSRVSMHGHKGAKSQAQSNRTRNRRRSRDF